MNTQKVNVFDNRSEETLRRDYILCNQCLHGIVGKVVTKLNLLTIVISNDIPCKKIKVDMIFTVLERSIIVKN